MANFGADGNGLQYGFLKKRQDVSFFQSLRLARKSLKVLQK